MYSKPFSVASVSTTDLCSNTVSLEIVSAAFNKGGPKEDKGKQKELSPKLKAPEDSRAITAAPSDNSENMVDTSDAMLLYIKNAILHVISELCASIGLLQSDGIP